ncbi:hypothetical protein BDV93DRAFT_518744 [Ceratobasidium sp. AG-I]|nr:hypothetical protein BDV93DRAFT_518744 [Ceratobasidium sp. AG-I]
MSGHSTAMFDSIVLVLKIPLRAHVVLRFALPNNADTMSQYDSLRQRNLCVCIYLSVLDCAFYFT